MSKRLSCAPHATCGADESEDVHVSSDAHPSDVALSSIEGATEVTSDSFSSASTEVTSDSLSSEDGPAGTAGSAGAACAAGPARVGKDITPSWNCRRSSCAHATIRCNATDARRNLSCMACLEFHVLCPTPSSAKECHLVRCPGVTP